MDFRILGPLEVINGAEAAPIGGPKQRAVLAMLLVHANEVVSRDVLIDALWGERAPLTAQRSLESYISRLRATLGANRIERRAPGYLVRIAPGELDSDRFDEFTEQALRMRDDDPRATLARLDAALALWRGSALADLTDEPALATEAARLEDRRTQVEEERVEMRLRLGDGRSAIADAERLVNREPLRERPRALLMRALYQANRAPQALEAFQEYRRLLADELGLEPGPQLASVQQAVLTHDQALAAPPQMPHRALAVRHRRNLRAWVMAAAALAAGATVTALLLTLGPPAAVSQPGPAVVELIAGRPSGGAILRGTPAATASAAGSIWVSVPDASEIDRIDPRSRSVVDRVPIVGNPGPITFAGGALWTTDVLGARILRLDPATDRITQSVALGSHRAVALAANGNRMWVADVTENALVEVDARSGAILRTLLLAHRPTAIVADGRTVWVASYDAGVVDAVDRRTGLTVASLRVGNGPAAIAEGDHTIWVANSLDSTVSRIDPGSGVVAPVVPVGSAPSAIEIADGSVWVANEYGASVTRIDAADGRVVQTTPVGGAALALASTGRGLWVGLRTLEIHRGGTLVLLHQRPVTIDPAWQLDLTPPQSDGLVRDSLVTFDHAAAPEGTQIVPDLAVSIPSPTDSGRTYTFRLRRGLRYSDGRLVRARDFLHAIERVFFLGAPVEQLLQSISGTASCRPRMSCDLSRGIVTDDVARTIAYHLTRADPLFLQHLTSLAAAPVPPGTPEGESPFPGTRIPGTGPYRVASATAREIRYVRNPYFHEWSHAAQPQGNPDTIVMRFGLSPDKEAGAVADGRADWTADQIPPTQLTEIAREYGSRLRTFAITETDFYRLNTKKAPFDDERVRRAVNLALDRRRIAATYGGPLVATPTCQIIPPGLPGFRLYCPYTRQPGNVGWNGPDVAGAQRLVTASHTRGARIALWGWTDDPTIRESTVREVARTLRTLGYRVTIELVPHTYFDNSAAAGVFARIDMLPAGWLDTDASSFFESWVACDGLLNGFFCDHAIDRLVMRARRLASKSARSAAATWAAADRRTVDTAALLPLVNPRQTDFVSARVRNFQHNPYWDILVDQLWLASR